MRAVARDIDNALVPDAWKRARIVHLGPLVQEVNSNVVDLFPDALVGVTPQGWMRPVGRVGAGHSLRCGIRRLRLCGRSRLSF